MTSTIRVLRALAPRHAAPLTLLFLAALMLSVSHALAHNVTAGDAGYIQEIWGVNIIPFIYLGAKHMVTGYDHILFLLGVVFFLYRMKDVAIYVSLFAIGHFTTMLLGVWYVWGLARGAQAHRPHRPDRGQSLRHDLCPRRRDFAYLWDFGI